MEPGRDLDALIAEKVTGWNMEKLNEYPWRNTPHYSTSIEAAWEIVQRMQDLPRKTGQWGGFQLSYDDHGWCATFWRQYSFGVGAPHAICLAALAALKACERERE